MHDYIYSFRQFEQGLGWVRIKQFISDMASWPEILYIRSSPEFRFIARALANTLTMEFALAIIAARKTSWFRSARTARQAERNIALVANTLVPILDRAGH